MIAHLRGKFIYKQPGQAIVLSLLGRALERAQRMALL